MTRAWACAGAATLAAAALALYLLTPSIGMGRLTPGVDVSAHQGSIDWRALAGTDVRFAYIKASEGASHVDPRFAENWGAARAAGLLVGAYHFFTLCQPGSVQAANFIAIAPKEAGALPPALDLEHKGPCRRGPTTTNAVGEVRAFLDIVEARIGVRPILYTTREFHDLHLRDLKGERFWLRSLATAPSFRRRDWVIWQNENRARRRGISGPVDLNFFRGDETALSRFTTARHSGAPRRGKRGTQGQDARAFPWVSDRALRVPKDAIFAASARDRS